MNLTDWFPGSVKPVRKGVYQRDYTYGKAKIPRYCYWDGKKWYAGAGTVEGAVFNVQAYASPNQSLRWRGVLK